MTDHKTWLWRKKSTEKTIVVADKVNLSLKGNEDEIEKLVTDKTELEKDLKNLNARLSSALSDCSAKDDLAKKHAKMAQEAIAGWEKAESEAVSLKQELDEALRQRVAVEERLSHLDAALKECMQQLRFVREEQEKRIHDAVLKTATEFEKTQMLLEEKLAETNKRLAKLGVENTHLSKALLAKEKLIEDLNEQKARAESNVNALMTRIDSTEKDNASLKYEVRVLEKELEIRNEEREFNRRAADASHKQHLESVKKIAKLESECQRLRLLVRKRLPGPAALVKMKNEVEMLGREYSEMQRRKLNPSPTGLMLDSAIDNSPDLTVKKINVLTEQLCAMAEENKTLKETLNKKISELQFSRIMYARTASKLSQVEARLEESSKGRTAMEETRSSFVSQDLSLASISDTGSDDKVSCAESWASALISELEHFREGKRKGTPCKTVGVSDMNLMDDFVEMEKLAIVSAEKPFGHSHVSPEEVNAAVGPLENRSGGFSSEAMSGEIVPVSDYQSGSSDPLQEIWSKDTSFGTVPGWLQDILKVILKQNHIAQRNPDEILEDIKVAMTYINHPNPGHLANARESPNHPCGSNLPHVGGYISWPNKSSVLDSSDRVTDIDYSPVDKSNQQFQSTMGKSICKIIELIEGIGLPSSDYDGPVKSSEKDGKVFAYKNSETPTGYMVRVFQWKTSELSAVLQQFIHSCNDLLSGKADIEKFAKELSSALDWIMNHCFSLQDVSSMRYAIKKQFDWDDTRSESEAEVGMFSHYSEADKFCVPKEKLSCLPIASDLNGDNSTFISEGFQSNMREENMKLKDELRNLESAKQDLEVRLNSAIDQSKALTNQLQQSEKINARLQTELQNSKEAKEMIEEQAENHKLMNEDLDTQLKVARVELNEARQKFSSLEVELENKNTCCEELEAACLELQLQLESAMKKETRSCDMDHEEKKLRTDWEITAASEKLAECQETILNLGKQLKALASPRGAALFDKVISTSSDTMTTTTTTTTTISPKKNMNQRSSLLDQMLAEDDADTKHLESPKTKETISTSNLLKPPLYNNSDPALGPNVAIEHAESFLGLNGTKHNEEAAVGSLRVVPSKKFGSGGLLRKLLWRKKKGNSKKTTLPLAAK